MARDEILRIAHETGCLDESHYGSLWADKLIAFAALVATAEREACAKLCADYTAWGREWGQDNNHMAAEAATNECAAAIRARGEK